MTLRELVAMCLEREPDNWGTGETDGAGWVVAWWGVEFAECACCEPGEEWAMVDRLRDPIARLALMVEVEP